jgi:tetratricopeptide (TPR) repeat protein
MSRIRPSIPAIVLLAVMGAGAFGVARFIHGTEPREALAGRKALADGRYDDAGKAIARWLRVAPDAPEAHFLQGRIAVAANRLPEAANELKRAQALGYPRDKLALLRALIASKAGRHAEAAPTLRQVFAEERVTDRQVDEALAKAFLETYDLPHAMEVLDRWARDFPADPKPHLWRAEIHGRTGGDQAALEVDYREALRRDPSLALARLGLAELLRKAHRNTAAAAEFNAYLAIEPDSALAHLGAGRNLMELGDEAAAIGHLNRALALDGENPEPLKEMAEAATRRGHWVDSLALLDRAIALDPCDMTVRHSRGLALMRLGRADEARAEQAAADRLRKDLDRLNNARSRLIASPNDRQSQLEIARWMFEHAHEREGVRWALKIVGEWPDDPEASRLLADYHERRGEAGLANFYRLHSSTAPEPSPVPKQEDRR